MSNKFKMFGHVYGGGGSFSPLDVAGLVEWHNPAGLDTMGLSDGQQIGPWPDASGNGNTTDVDFLGSGGIGPTYKVNIVNGLSVGRCNGVNNMALRVGLVTGLLAQPHTYYFVMKEDSANVDAWQDGSADRNLIGANGANYQIFAGGIVIGSSRTLNAWKVVEAQFNTTSSFLTENGTSKVTGNAGGQGFGSSGSYIAGIDQGTGHTFKGDIAEWIWYNAAVSAGNRTSIRNYLYAKYGISGT